MFRIESITVYQMMTKERERDTFKKKRKEQNKKKDSTKKATNIYFTSP